MYADCKKLRIYGKQKAYTRRQYMLKQKTSYTQEKVTTCSYVRKWNQNRSEIQKVSYRQKANYCTKLRTITREAESVQGEVYTVHAYVKNLSHSYNVTICSHVKKLRQHRSEIKRVSYREYAVLLYEVTIIWKA